MPGKWLKRAGILFDRILSVTPVLASILLYGMMCIVCYEVFMRYFLDRPTTWVMETSGLILLWIPFLVCAWVDRREGHVRMDLVITQFGSKSRALLNTVTAALTAATSLVLAGYGFKLAWQLYLDDFKTETLLRLTKWPLLLIIPVGFLLLLIESLRKMKNAFDEWQKPRP